MLRDAFHALVLGVAFAASSAAQAQIEADEVAYRARLAADYLASVQLPNGFFAYEYDFAPARVLDDDNIVRQAGTAFGLALFLNWSDDPSYRRYTERALRALVAFSKPHAGGMLVTADDDAVGAPTGATALALLAELNYVEATGDGGFADARAAWVGALAALQRPRGGFAQAPGGDTESPYYNGETWLALAHYNRLFPDDDVIVEVAAKADEYLTAAYSDAPDPAFFQWGLMAAAVRHETIGSGRFLDFMATQSAVFLTALRPAANPNNNDCAAVEGLAAAAAAFVKGGRGTDDLQGRITLRIDDELTNSLALQIMPGQGQIRLGEQRYLIDPEIARFAGAFLNGRYQSRTRIDATVHCLSALVNYAEMLRARVE